MAAGTTFGSQPQAGRSPIRFANQEFAAAATPLLAVALIQRPRRPGPPRLHHLLDVNAAAVHLVIEPDDRRPVEMPAQPVPQHAAAAELAFENRMDVLDGIE